MVQCYGPTRPRREVMVQPANSYHGPSQRSAVLHSKYPVFKISWFQISRGPRRGRGHRHGPGPEGPAAAASLTLRSARCTRPRGWRGRLACNFCFFSLNPNPEQCWRSPWCGVFCHVAVTKYRSRSNAEGSSGGKTCGGKRYSGVWW